MNQRGTMLTPHLLLPLVVALLLGGIAIADDDWKPVFNPTMSTVRASGPIKIDGDLSDPGWQGVGQVTNFVERFPGENTKPEVETRAFITYNDEYLYVGFICYDDPSQIRATMCQRDQFNGDDAVRFMVDTYGEASIGYEFLVNPYGVQKDRLHSAQGGGTGYDLIWESAATITSTGYQVEIAVPFRSIRFPGTDTQVWRVDFQRNRPRDSYYTYSWAANDRNEQCYMCKWGTVTGIADVYPGKGLEVLPTMVGDQFGELPNWSTDSSFRNENPDAEISLGGKYSISSGMTLETYYNPDFSQIEADAAQIDVNSTIALFFPERRPFFQEGTDLFNTLFNSFYTRTVYDPQFAAKLTSRTDRNSMAFITAVDERSPYTVPLEEGGSTFDVGKSYVNMLRGKRAFTNGSEIGFMLTDRRFEGGGSGSIASVDGRIRLSRTYSIIGQFVGSHTTEPHSFTDELQGMLDTIPDSAQAAFRDSVMEARGDFDHGKYTIPLDGESYNGTALITQLRRFGRSWYLVLNYDQVGPSYRTQTGYDPWNNQRNSRISAGYTFYPSGSIFERISPEMNLNARWNYDGVRKWRHGRASLYARLRTAQTNLNASYQVGEELWNQVEFDNLWSVRFSVDSRPIDEIGAFVSVRTGQDAAISVGGLGDENSVNLSLDLKPIDRLIIEPDLSWVKSTYAEDGSELFRQFIGRTRLRLQISPQLSIRLVAQYNDRRVRVLVDPDEPMSEQPVFSSKRWEVDPLITYRISPFSVFYIGSTSDYRELYAGPNEPYQWKLTNRNFFMKLQYLFQI